MAMTAPARIVVGLGALGLILTVVNQATAPALEPPLERAAVLAGILSVLLMLVGVLGERVLPLEAERAALTGREGLELSEGLPPELARELGWGSTLLLTATPAAVVLVLWNGRAVLRRGLLADTAYVPGPIADRALATGRADLAGGSASLSRPRRVRRAARRTALRAGAADRRAGPAAAGRLVGPLFQPRRPALGGGVEPPPQRGLADRAGRARKRLTTRPPGADTSIVPSLPRRPRNRVPRVSWSLLLRRSSSGPSASTSWVLQFH
jgi:Protein of unknown function (DUF2930).